MSKMQPDEDDEFIWNKYVENIFPISKKQIFYKKTKKLSAGRHVNYQKAYSGNALTSIKNGTSSDVDKNTAKKFKQGKFAIEGRLDLHGLTEKEAWDSVCEFVKKSYIEKKRCIIIITGKGHHIHKNDDIFSTQGVLKEQLPKWLNTSELRPLILSYSEALPKDGGSGAFYILLRRQRN